VPGGSPIGYRVVGDKFRRFPLVCGPMNPCACLLLVGGVFLRLLGVFSLGMWAPKFLCDAGCDLLCISSMFYACFAAIADMTS
jgi:hypothetical protein